ncbi:hypothetical protein BaRGS_00009601 [Batillaria attramentaria]|uniref:Uncharacterized protein n=1 Tax=Batillaria attramentaria TaxID=370345 RepID=A0ABD0LHS6_9CAEN
MVPLLRRATRSLCPSSSTKDSGKWNFAQTSTAIHNLQTFRQVPQLKFRDGDCGKRERAHKKERDWKNEHEQSKRATNSKRETQWCWAIPTGFASQCFYPALITV